MKQWEATQAPGGPVSLDIIIVNWNAGSLLRDCLDSIRSALTAGSSLKRVVVVDNGSADGSADGLQDLPGLPLCVLRNACNRGFAAACNQGARGSQADYLLFLNPDVRLFRGSLRSSVEFMEHPENVRVGICGIQLVDDNEIVARSCARFPTAGRFFAKMFALDRLLPAWFPGHFMREWDHGITCQVDQVIGAFFLVRRAVFEALGGFDERFFVYFEEVDFSLRARRQGWLSVYFAEAQAYHKGEVCSGQAKAARLFYSLRSRLLYSYKHFETWQASLLSVGTLLLEPLSRTVGALLRGELESIEQVTKAYLRLWQELPRILAYPRGGTTGPKTRGRADTPDIPTAQAPERETNAGGAPS
jgi:N-acetylglucosaminyl-diphospho-decaprenol L-rhamnosyltransferase